MFANLFAHAPKPNLKLNKVAPRNFNIKGVNLGTKKPSIFKATQQIGRRVMFQAGSTSAGFFQPKSFISNLIPRRSLMPRKNKMMVTSVKFLPAISFVNQKRYFAEQKEEKAQQNTEQTNQNQNQQKENEQNKTDALAQAKIKELEESVNQLKTKLQYTYAEMQNISRIAKLDVEKANKYGIQSFAKSLLGVSDNLARCLSHVKADQQSEDYKMLVEGVRMVEKDLLKVFGNFGVVKFNPLGEKFDPNRMNAITQFEDPQKETGSVGLVMNEGYMFHDRVLRAADVGVVKAKSN